MLLGMLVAPKRYQVPPGAGVVGDCEPLSVHAPLYEEQELLTTEPPSSQFRHHYFYLVSDPEIYDAPSQPKI